MTIPSHPAYVIHGQESQCLPLVVDSPHSWRSFPADFHPVCSEADLLTSWDAFTDELFAATVGLGGVQLVSRFPRFYIDTNRARDDIDPAMLDGDWIAPVHPSKKSDVGMGLLRKYALPGILVHGGKLPVAAVLARLENYYDPYHDALQHLVDQTAQRFGAVLHIDCHSMKSRGNAMNDDEGAARPDFVISDRDGQTASLPVTAYIADTIAALGYDVAINNPYKGAELIQRHGAPDRGRHSVQIEVNRAIYMDEARFEKNASFADVQHDLNSAMAKIAANVVDLLRDVKRHHVQS